MKGEPKKIKVLICGILPPPYFGHSMLYKMLMASSFPDAFDVKFLNMRFWTYGTDKKVTIQKLFKMVQYFLKFKWILIFWRPRYVLYNSSFYKMPFLKDLLFCSMAILAGSRLVIHDHGQYVRELDESLTGLKKKSLRWMLRHMHASIIMGQKVRQDYEALSAPQKLLVVPGTVEDTRDIKVDSVKAEGRTNVLYFSYMSRSKGVFTAFEGLDLVLQEREEVTVTFGGPLEGPDVREALEKFQLNYPGRIYYAGYVEDVAERTRLFRQADIFIFPTLRDVFGLVLLHAMAEGLPIVASREGTIPEIVPDGKNGLLFEKGDARALAGNILKLVFDSDLRNQMGQANRRRFEEQYTLEKYGQAMVDAFKQMEAL
ncbi:MAG: glycosyltransferase family 4 protein [Candidatus Omnitrophica bacterium]|nr:glycosyltransferase family 4 protein [Candidatus Omnitrophota bacterium]MDE2223076.1 glycosyltransferase family 4 protein [Candidatus Omnitrophota bacterium]